MTGQRFDRTVSWAGPATALTAVLLSVAGCGSTGTGTSPDPGRRLPEPGSMVDDGSFITATVKKSTDD